MTRPKGRKNALMKDVQVDASSHREATSNSQPNNQNEILEQLIPCSNDDATNSKPYLVVSRGCSDETRLMSRR